MRYKRILLKLSGEALMGTRQYGIDPERLAEYAKDIKDIIDLGVEVAFEKGPEEFQHRSWFGGGSLPAG